MVGSPQAFQSDNPSQVSILFLLILLTKSLSEDLNLLAEGMFIIVNFVNLS